MALPFLRWIGGRAVRVIDGTLTAWATGVPSGVELFVRTLPA